MDWTNKLELPALRQEHLPYAYALMAVGALVLVKKPTTIVSLLSAYYMWNTVLEKGKKSLFSA